MTPDARPVYRGLGDDLILRPLFDESCSALVACALVLSLWLIFFAPSLIGEETKETGAGPRLDGDVDGSGRVDEKDRFLMEKAIGANPSDPEWDPRCDLDGDGLVSFKDFLIVEVNMGKALPGLGSERSSCGFPELIFAPRIPMREFRLNGAQSVETKLEFCVGRDGHVISVRPILSDLEPDAEKMLLVYARGWYFEAATNPAMDNGDSYSIITMRCQDLIGLDEGPLPE